MDGGTLRRTRELSAPKLLLSLSRRGGEVVRYRAFPSPAYLINRPEQIKHVFVDNFENYAKGTPFGNGVWDVLGRGLLTMEGAPWRDRRNFMRPLFQRHRVVGFGPRMVEAVGELLDRWEEPAATGKAVEICAEMTSLVLRISADALFGVDIRDQAGELGRTLALADVLGLPLLPRDAVAQQRLVQLGRDIVRWHRGLRAPSGDVLSEMLHAPDGHPGKPADDDAILGEVNNLLLASFDTTSYALSWTWYLLSQHPSVLARLEAEVDRVLGGRLPSVDDLQDLPTVQAVLDESLRLYPPGWIIGRWAIRGDQLDGHRLPAGTVIAVSPYTAHRNVEDWDRPEEFDPDRFRRERTPAKHPFVYFPFGGGPRRCLGEGFALQEAQLVIAAVAQRYRLRLASGVSVTAQGRTIIRPRHGLPMTVHRRRD